MSNAADEFLFGGGVPSAFGKDDPIGKTVTGQILSTQVKQQTDLQTGKPETWDNGDPKMQLVVTIQTALRDPQVTDDDGRRSLYIKGSKKAGSQSPHDAVVTAVRNAGARSLEVGGTLTMRLVGTEPSSTRGFNDRKLYEAQYVAPNPSGGFLGVEQPQQQAPAYAPPAQGYQPPAQPIPPAPAIQGMRPGTVLQGQPGPAVQQQQPAPQFTPEQIAAFAAYQQQQAAQQS